MQVNQQLTNEVGAADGKRVGFTMFYEGENNLKIEFQSGVNISQFGQRDNVPAEFKAKVIEAVGRTYGKNVTEVK